MPVLGKVGLVNRGTYSASASYTALDFVLYNGSSYVALKNVSGITPSNDGTNWQTLAEGTAASLYLKNNLTYDTAGEYALDAAQGPVIKGLIDKKANSLSPILKFRIGGNSGDATAYPHAELRESGTAGSTKALSLVYYTDSTTSRAMSFVNKDGDFFPSLAPKSHAATDTGYGLGTATNYGHVKMSDTYASKVSSGAAANGLAASQNALYNAYANRAPISHASTATTYGQGNASNFGHVKLSNTYSSSVTGGDAAGGIAASQNALYNVYNTLKNRADSIGFVEWLMPDTEISVANDTIKNITSYSFTQAGRYIVLASLTFASNATGYREIGISDDTTGIRRNRMSAVTAAPPSGRNHEMQVVTVVSGATVGQKIYFNCRQTSGGALTVNGIGMIVVKVTG